MKNYYLFLYFLSLYYHGQPSEQPRMQRQHNQRRHLRLLLDLHHGHRVLQRRRAHLGSPHPQWQQRHLLLQTLRRTLRKAGTEIEHPTIAHPARQRPATPKANQHRQAVGNRQPGVFFARHYFLLIFATGRQPLPYTRNCIKYNAIHHTTRSVSARQYGTNAKKSTLDHSTDTDTPGHCRDVGRTMLMHRTSVCRVPVGRRLLSHRQQLHDDSHNATVRLCAHCRNNPRPTPATMSGHDPPPCGQADATPPVAHTAGGPRPRAPRPLGRNDCHTEGLTLSSKRH